MDNFCNVYIDFGRDNVGEEAKLSKRTIKLNNNRVAIVGIIGLMIHKEITPPLTTVSSSKGNTSRPSAGNGCWTMVGLFDHWEGVE